MKKNEPKLRSFLPKEEQIIIDGINEYFQEDELGASPTQYTAHYERLAEKMNRYYYNDRYVITAKYLSQIYNKTSTSERRRDEIITNIRTFLIDKRWKEISLQENGFDRLVKSVYPKFGALFIDLKIEEAKSLFHKTLKFVKDDKDGYARSVLIREYFRYAVIYSPDCKDEKELLFEALQFFENKKYLNDAFETKAIFANMHILRQDYLSAEQNLKECLEYSMAGNDLVKKAATLGSYAIFLKGTGKSEEAIEYFEKCLDISNTLIQSTDVLLQRSGALSYATGQYNLAKIYADSGNLTEARDSICQALYFYRALEHRREMAMALLDKAEFEWELGLFDLDSWYKDIDEAYDLSEEIKAFHLQLDCVQLKAKIAFNGNNEKFGLQLLLDHHKKITSPDLLKAKSAAYIGTHLFEKENFALSKKYLEEAKRLYEINDQPLEFFHYEISLAMIYRKEKNFEESDKIFKKVIDYYYYILPFNQSKSAKAKIHFDIGKYYAYWERHMEAVSAFNKAAVLYGELENSYKAIESVVYAGDSLYLLDRFNEALVFFTTALAMVSGTDFFDKEAFIQMRLGEILYYRDPEIAKSFFKKSEDLVRIHNLPYKERLAAIQKALSTNEKGYSKF